MAVLEDRAGQCVPGDAPVEWSSSAAEVIVEQQAGPCVRWLHLRPRDVHDRVVLEATYDGEQSAVTVPLDGQGQLAIRVRRRGSRLLVAVLGFDGREDVSGIVRTTSGEVALESEGGGRLSAVVSEDGVLGVVVRSGAMVGVAGVAPSSPPGEPQVLVLAADLAIEAGGPPREAAFVVAVDARGRLSSTLPLNIESARGVLTSLRWLDDGTAAVALSAPVSVNSVDLSVGIGEQVLANALLEVTAHWPVEGRLEVPGAIADGESFGVRVSAYGADGSPLDASRMRVRCGLGAYTAAPFVCPAVAGPATQTVAMGALVDGRVVPLATHSIVIRAPEPVVVPARPAPRFLAELALRGSFDLWSRAGFGAALRLWHQTTSWLRMGVGAQYTGVRLQASALNNTIGALSGIRHDLGVFALAEASLGDRAGAGLRAALGGGYGRASARISDGDASGRSAYILARVSAGPRLRLDGVEFGADVGASFGVDLGHRAWERPWLAGFMEVFCAMRF
ncbi:MAG: hypothetical protein ACI9KE_005475 [Polyangiales bacterium]|jgi:hypothetical protein